MRSAPRSTVAALLLLLPLSACSSDEPEASAPEPSAGAPTSAPAAPDVPPTVPVDVPTAVPTSAAGARIVLRPDGIALQNGSSTVPIAFGAGTSVVVPAIAAALGEPEQQTVACGQGPRTAVGSKGFDVLFDGDRFVGWDESGAGLATPQGLRIGSTKADVQRLFPTATFSRSTLGDEFLVTQGGLAGFLDGPQATSRVVGLTGGQACVAR